jgi:excisionase family DNA binding protein
VPLPEEVYRVLVQVVEALQERKVITVVPRTQRITTQEAADFLGVSRPTLVKLLEDGRSRTTSRGGTAASCSRTCLPTGSGSGMSATRRWTG